MRRLHAALLAVLMTTLGCSTNKPAPDEPGPRTPASQPFDGGALYCEGDVGDYFRAHRVMVACAPASSITALPEGGWRLIADYPSVNFSHADDQRHGTWYPQPVRISNTRRIPVDPARIDGETLLVLEAVDVRKREFELIGTVKGDTMTYFQNREELWYTGPR